MTDHNKDVLVSYKANEKRTTFDRTTASLIMVFMDSLSLSEESNSSNVSTYKPPNLGRLANDTEITRAIKTFALSALIAVSIFGNSLVIASVYKNVNKRMRVVSNYLIVNLSIADMFLAIFSLSRMITLVHVGYEWLVGGGIGLFLCKAQNFFIIQLLFVSTLNFMAIAIDRFVAVFFPLSDIMKGKLLYFIIAATWVIPSILFAFFWKMMEIEVRGGTTVCFANVLEVFPTVEDFYKFKIAENIIITGVTLAITVGLYVAIGVKLLLRRLPGDQQEVNTRHSEAVARRVVRMMVCVVLVFCLCWSPNWILSTVCNFIDPRKKVCRDPNAGFIKLVVAYSNSAITPFIYPIFSENFRTSFKRILRDMFCCKRGTVSPQSSSSRRKPYETQRGGATADSRPQVFLLEDRSSK